MKISAIFKILFLVLVPLAVNTVALKVWVAPRQASLGDLRETLSFLESKGRLESLLAESEELAGRWEGLKTLNPDPMVALMEIKKMASAQRLRVGENTSKSFQLASGSSDVSIQLDVSADDYDHLAQWLEKLEREPGIQIESWSLESPSTASDTIRMQMVLKLALRRL